MRTPALITVSNQHEKSALTSQTRRQSSNHPLTKIHKPPTPRHHDPVVIFVRPAGRMIKDGDRRC